MKGGTEEAQTVVCPACQRIRGRAPAGVLEIGGPFFEAHREEVLNPARNAASAEQNLRPLNRIMAIAEKAEGVEITGTDIHLLRRIAEALRRGFHGELKLPSYGEDSNFFRASWRR